MANQLRFSKVASLPATLAPSTVYMIPSATTGIMEMYVSTLDGASSYRMLTMNDVTALINTVTASDVISEYTSYANLTASTVKSGIAIVYGMSDYNTTDPLSSTSTGLFVWNSTLATPAWVLVSVYDTASNEAVSRISEDANKNITYRGLPIPVTLSAEAW